MTNTSETPYLLHLSIDLNPGRFADLARALKRYGKCSNGRYFTRDIVVPGDMNLYALHYAIQNLYGFYDAHSWKFCLSDKRFIELTDYNLEKISEYCGSFLKVPEAEKINDDEEEEITTSRRAWFRTQYTGPYRKIEGESYEEQQEKLRKNPIIVQEVSREESNFLMNYFTRYANKVNISRYNSLLLSLPLSKVLSPGSIRQLTPEEWNSNYNKDDPAEFGYLTKKLEYHYDYDFLKSWNIVITRPARNNFPDEVKDKVLKTHCPVCLDSDGFYLIDDVCGVYDYVNFVKCIFGGKPDEESEFDDPVETYEWAETSYEWSKKKVKPEKML